MMDKVAGLRQLLDIYTIYDKEEKGLYNEIIASYPGEEGKLSFESIHDLQHLSIHLENIHSFMDDSLTIIGIDIETEVKERALQELINSQTVLQFRAIAMYLTVFYHTCQAYSDNAEVTRIMHYFENAMVSADVMTIGDLWKQHEAGEAEPKAQ